MRDVLHGLWRRWRARVLMRRLHVRESARYDAEQTPAQPPQTCKSACERAIAHNLADRIAALARKRLRAIGQQIIDRAQTTIDAGLPAIKDKLRETKNDIAEKRLLFHRDLTPLRAEAKSRADELAAFRKVNLLTRGAFYADFDLALGIMLLALVVEMAGTGLLFAQVSKWGVSGGVVNALVLTVPTLTLAALGSFYGLRYRNHTDAALRTRGTMVAVTAFALLANWLYFLAQLRIVAERTDILHQQLLIADWSLVADHILARPFAPFASPAALALLAISAVTAAFATFDFYTGFCDRYPGYCTVDRRFRKALAAIEDVEQQFIAELSSYIDEAILAIKDRLSKGHASFGRALKLLARAVTTVLLFEQKAADEAWIHARAGAEYQSLNARLRPSGTTPDRFADPPLADVCTALPGFDAKAILARLREGISALDEAADAAIAALKAEKLRLIADASAVSLAFYPHTATLASPAPLLPHAKESPA